MSNTFDGNGNLAVDNISSMYWPTVRQGLVAREAQDNNLSSILQQNLLTTPVEGIDMPIFRRIHDFRPGIFSYITLAAMSWVASTSQDNVYDPHVLMLMLPSFNTWTEPTTAPIVSLDNWTSPVKPPTL